MAEGKIPLPKKRRLGPIEVNVGELYEESAGNFRPLSAAPTGSLIKNYANKYQMYMTTNITKESMPKKMFVRDSYRVLYDEIKKRLTKGMEDRYEATKGTEEEEADYVVSQVYSLIQICGTPNIGKTQFLYYVLARLCEDFNYLEGVCLLAEVPGGRHDTIYATKIQFEKRVNGDKYLFVEKISDVLYPKENDNVVRDYQNYIFMMDNAKTLGPTLYCNNNDCLIFSSPKALGNNRKCVRDDLWMSVWDNAELQEYINLVNPLPPQGKKSKCPNDIDDLMYYFGGAIGNMTFPKRDERIEVLEGKCREDIKKGYYKRLHDIETQSAFSSLLEFGVGDELEHKSTRYLSPYIAEYIRKGVCGEMNGETAKKFASLQIEDRVAAGNFYETCLAAYMRTGKTLKVQMTPYGREVYATQIYNEEKRNLEFTCPVWQQTSRRPFCITVNCAVRMWRNSPSIDFYTIQERKNENNNPKDDVMSGEGDDIQCADGNTNGYDVYVLQATVGKKHNMDFNVVISFLQKLDGVVRGEINNTTTTTMKNSLLSARVSIFLCYLQPDLEKEFEAPTQDALTQMADTRTNTYEGRIRSLLRKKVQVMYGNANPFSDLADIQALPQSP